MDLSLRKYLEDYTDWPLTELYSLSNNPYLWTKEESLLMINAKCYLETESPKRTLFCRIHRRSWFTLECLCEFIVVVKRTKDPERRNNNKKGLNSKYKINRNLCHE